MESPEGLIRDMQRDKIGTFRKVSLQVATYLRARKYKTRFEARELEALFEFMPHGGCSLDIGAYKGAWTYWMSKIAGAKGKVIAFEPQLDAVKLLRTTQAVMGWNNVRIERCGVSDKNGLSPLYSNTHAIGITQGANLNGGPRQKLDGYVSVITLDDYRLTNQIPKISFIKIDAEGCESRIIQGARETIRQDRPTIVLECDGNFIGEPEQKSFFRLMDEIGYDGQFFTDIGRKPLSEFDFTIHQKQNLPRGLSDPLYYNNFLFTPRK